MDNISAPLGPCDITFRGTTVNVTSHMEAALERMRAALIAVAQTGTTMTYTQLEAATGHAYNRRQFGAALDVMAIDCLQRGEPSLASLVVHKGGDAEVGDGFIGDAPLERERCYAVWG